MKKTLYSGKKDFTIDFIKKDNKYFAKWSFESDSEYIQVEIKTARYHHTQGEPMTEYITFGGWAFWLLDFI